jgi:hypothetical protein
LETRAESTSGNDLAGPAGLRRRAAIGAAAPRREQATGLWLSVVRSRSLGLRQPLRQDPHQLHRGRRAHLRRALARWCLTVECEVPQPAQTRPSGAGRRGWCSSHQARGRPEAGIAGSSTPLRRQRRGPMGQEPGHDVGGTHPVRDGGGPSILGWVGLTHVTELRRNGVFARNSAARVSAQAGPGPPSRSGLRPPRLMPGRPALDPPVEALRMVAFARGTGDATLDWCTSLAQARPQA